MVYLLAVVQYIVSFPGLFDIVLFLHTTELGGHSDPGQML